jgi:hypothetical protein
MSKRSAFPISLLVALATAAFAQDCTLIVPKNPLTAVGLATPYVLTGGPQCSQVSAASVSTDHARISIHLPVGHLAVAFSRFLTCDLN